MHGALGKLGPLFFVLALRVLTLPSIPELILIFTLLDARVAFFYIYGSTLQDNVSIKDLPTLSCYCIQQSGNLVTRTTPCSYIPA